MIIIAPNSHSRKDKEKRRSMEKCEVRRRKRVADYALKKKVIYCCISSLDITENQLNLT